MMSKSVATAHASINQFVSPAKEKLATFKVKHDLQVCMKGEYKVCCKRSSIYSSHWSEESQADKSGYRIQVKNAFSSSPPQLPCVIGCSFIVNGRPQAWPRYTDNCTNERSPGKTTSKISGGNNFSAMSFKLLQKVSWNAKKMLWMLEKEVQWMQQGQILCV